MDHKRLRIIKSFFFAVLLLLICFNNRPVFAQENKSYEFLPAPDLWYNDVDGIRAGIRIRGQQPGTFEDGPHRLDLGLWLGTWIPDDPVSYYLSFTEPISSITDFGSEGNVALKSSIRTGLHQHGIVFNKRWQQGFNEQIYREFSLGLIAQKRYNDRYVVFPLLWQDDWLYLIETAFLLNDENRLGSYLLSSDITVNFAGVEDSFISSSTTVEQHVPLGNFFNIKSRLFLGIASNGAAPEYLFSSGLDQSSNWIDKGLTRAKGTIPVPWMESGTFQIAGGANLRGYTDQIIEQLNSSISPLLTSISAFNFEIDYANPLDRAISEIPVIGGILNVRSYLFFDTGTSLGLTSTEERRWLSDAGTGFMLSLNIPDYLGKPRGIVLRFDIPFWLSNPEFGNSEFKFRSVVGIGAIFSL